MLKQPAQQKGNCFLGVSSVKPFISTDCPHNAHGGFIASVDMERKGHKLGETAQKNVFR